MWIISHKIQNLNMNSFFGVQNAYTENKEGKSDFKDYLKSWFF